MKKNIFFFAIPSNEILQKLIEAGCVLYTTKINEHTALATGLPIIISDVKTDENREYIAAGFNLKPDTITNDAAKCIRSLIAKNVMIINDENHYVEMLEKCFTEDTVTYLDTFNSNIATFLSLNGF